MLIDNHHNDADIDAVVLACEDAVALIAQIVLMAPRERQWAVCTHVLTEMTETVEHILGGRTCTGRHHAN
jgi:hypothetical protein